ERQIVSELKLHRGVEVAGGTAADEVVDQRRVAGTGLAAARGDRISPCVLGAVGPRSPRAPLRRFVEQREVRRLWRRAEKRSIRYHLRGKRRDRGARIEDVAQARRQVREVGLRAEVLPEARQEREVLLVADLVAVDASAGRVLEAAHVVDALGL